MALTRDATLGNTDNAVVFAKTLASHGSLLARRYATTSHMVRLPDEGPFDARSFTAIHVFRAERDDRPGQDKGKTGRRLAHGPARMSTLKPMNC